MLSAAWSSHRRSSSGMDKKISWKISAMVAGRADTALRSKGFWSRAIDKSAGQIQVLLYEGGPMHEVFPSSFSG